VSADKKGPGIPLASLTPVGVLRSAITAVPSVRYALGVGGLAAVVAIVLVGWKLEAQSAIFGTLIVLIFMVSLVIFSALAGLGAGALKPLALVLAWSFLVLAVGVAVLFVACAFFDEPKTLPCLLRNECPEKGPDIVGDGLSLPDESPRAETPAPVTPLQRAPEENRNLLTNASFEQISMGGSPRRWELRKWQSIGAGNIDTTIAYSGANSVTVSSEIPAHVSWSQPIRVERQTVYVVSAMLRTADLTNEQNPNYVLGANICILGIGDTSEQIVGYSEPVLGTSDWRLIEVRFDSGNYDRIRVMLELGGYGATATGTAWFDDVSLQVD